MFTTECQRLYRSLSNMTGRLGLRKLFTFHKISIYSSDKKCWLRFHCSTSTSGPIDTVINACDDGQLKVANLYMQALLVDDVRVDVAFIFI